MSKFSKLNGLDAVIESVLLESGSFRDSRKSKAYFDKYIEYQKDRIEKKKAKLEEADGNKKQKILVSLIGYYTDFLKAKVSIGSSTGDIKKLLSEALSVCSEYNNATYDDLLTLLSLGVIVGGNVSKLISSNSQTIGKDRLLSYLAGKGEWNENIPLKSEFSGLDKVFSSEEKESAMMEYLDKWYNAHKDYSWFNSHKGDQDTYCGYWSFEAAAIAKKLKLNEASLASKEFYPKL